MEERQKKHGDRYDGYLVPENDPMHMIMPYIMGGRADNEALMNDDFDMAPIIAYMAKKNETAEHKWTYFHVILAALAKTVYNRPLMNRYILGGKYYDRKDISFTFTAKNKFADNAGESLVIFKARDNDEPIAEQVHKVICDKVYKIKVEEKNDDTTSFMSALCKIPRFILKAIIGSFFWMDAHGILPKGVIDIDPYRSTAFVSNLGSIKMQASYHHLINWSSCSIFVITNKVRKIPVFNDDGTYEMKDMMNIAFTIDERIADGFYFMKSIEILRYLIAHPELLDEPLSAPLPMDEIFKK